MVCKGDSWFYEIQWPNHSSTLAFHQLQPHWWIAWTSPTPICNWYRFPLWGIQTSHCIYWWDANHIEKGHARLIFLVLAIHEKHTIPSYAHFNEFLVIIQPNVSLQILLSKGPTKISNACFKVILYREGRRSTSIKLTW